jgi:hypothetical protein
MQDNIFINSLFSDKKSAQLSNAPPPQVLKTLDDPNKTSNPNPISSLPVNNLNVQNSTINGSPKNSPKKMSIVSFSI